MDAKKMMRSLLLLILCFSFPSYALTYVIGRDPTWYQAALNQQEAAKVTAFTNALLQEVARDHHTSFALLDTSPLNLFENLENGQYDAILSTLTPNIKTTSLFQFSTPLLWLGPVLVTRENGAPKGLKDLKGKTVGVNAFDNSILIVQKIPSIVIKSYDDMRQGLDDLAFEKIDGLLLGSLQAYQLVPSYGGVLKIQTPPLNDLAVRLLTVKGENNLVLFLNMELKRTKRSGLYKRLLQEYNIY